MLEKTCKNNNDFPSFFKTFRPDFDASREKLRRLGDAEGTLTKEEFNKMKQELEAEYLATFKVNTFYSIFYVSVHKVGFG